MNKSFPAINLSLYGAPLALALLAGCSSGGSSVAITRFNPSAAAQKAMALYDADGDGFIAGEELDNAPGLRAAMKTIDTDQDGRISQEELAHRIRDWQSMEIGLMSFSCDVLLDGLPVEGATVTFEPEPFLSDSIQPAVGVTSVLGATRPKIPKEKRPSPDTPPGIQPGLYIVRISKMVAGKETIPARYNSATILGQEVSRDDRAITNKQVRFEMSSK